MRSLLARLLGRLAAGQPGVQIVAGGQAVLAGDLQGGDGVQQAGLLRIEGLTVRGDILQQIGIGVRQGFRLS